MNSVPKSTEMCPDSILSLEMIEMLEMMEEGRAIAKLAEIDYESETADRHDQQWICWRMEVVTSAILDQRRARDTFWETLLQHSTEADKPNIQKQRDYYRITRHSIHSYLPIEYSDAESDPTPGPAQEPSIDQETMDEMDAEVDFPEKEADRDEMDPSDMYQTYVDYMNDMREECPDEYGMI